MRNKLFPLLLLGVILLALAVPAKAATITINLSGDRAEFTATVNVNMTGIPRSECDVYEGFHNMWRKPALKDGFTRVVKNYLEWYLRNVMKIEKASVENLSIEYNFVKGFHTYAVSPSAATNTTGKLVSGSLNNLTNADGVVMRFESLNSTNTMLIVVDLNFTLPSWVPADKLESLTISIVGNVSKTVSDKASIELYNYSSGSYDILNATALNATSSTEVKLTTTANNYVKDRVVKLRMNVTDVQSYPSTLVNLDLDKVELSFKYFTLSISIKLDLVLSGISNHTMTQRMFNVKFRAMNPKGTVEYNAFKFSPARLFFMNFDAFDIPLEKWERNFNGTHTTFKYTVTSLTVYTHGGYTISIDPTETIVVKGEATAEGDTIIVKEIATETWYLLGGIMTLIVAVAAILMFTKAFRHTIAELMEGKFVKKKS